LALLKFKDKHIAQSVTQVSTTETTLQDDTQATQEFTLTANQTVLVAYQANSDYGVAMPYTGMKNAINIDGTDRALSADSGYDVNYPIRNCSFWVGTLGAGSHTIKGRFCSNTGTGTVAISNRILLIYVFDGDEFQYIDSSTANTTTSTSFIDDANAQATFTPSATCQALYLYNVSNANGVTESSVGKKVSIGINGTDYGQVEQSPNGDSKADSVFIAYAGSLNAVSTTVKGRFAANEAYTVTVSNRQLGVLCLDNSTLLDIVDSATQVSTTETALRDDTQATINRTTGDRELLVFAVGTKKNNTTSSSKGECYGISINSNDRQISRSCPSSSFRATSAATCWAETVSAGSQVVQGRLSSNLTANTAIIDARIVVALWLSLDAGSSQTINTDLVRQVVVTETVDTDTLREITNSQTILTDTLRQVVAFESQIISADVLRQVVKDEVVNTDTKRLVSVSEEITIDTVRYVLIEIIENLLFYCKVTDKITCALSINNNMSIGLDIVDVINLSSKVGRLI